MRLNETRKSNRSISVTPLIDVVFLLLIFFMLVSTFLKFNAIPVATSGSAQAVSSNKEIVFVQIIGTQSLRINGKLVPTEGLISHLNAHVAQGITNAILKPMPDATVQDLVSALDQVRRSKLTNVVIAQ